MDSPVCTFSALTSSQKLTSSKVNVITEKDLSKDQKIVYDAMDSFYRRGSSKLLTVGGIAGSGKTSVLSCFAKTVKSRVAYCAFTGQAACVLRNKLIERGVDFEYCGTIHGLIYVPIINKKTKKIVGWERRKNLDYDFIIIDEGSMVGNDIWKDLLYYYKQILVVGDHAQLPPINSCINLMEKPMVKLDKIHRQAEGNPIIKLSGMIHNNEPYENFDFGDDRVSFIKKSDSKAINKFIESGFVDPASRLDSVILTYFNGSRVRFNQAIRHCLGHAPNRPVKDDIVICLKNWTYDDGSIFNGMRGMVNSISDGMVDTYDAKIDFINDSISIEGEVSIHQFNHEATFDSPEMADKLSKNDINSWLDCGLLFDYGYAITGHKCLHPDTLVETPQGLIRINKLSTQGNIATPNGNSKYKNLIFNNESEMLEIETKDGFRLRVTPNHGVDIWNGVTYARKEAKDIIETDIVRLKLGTTFNNQESIKLHKPINGDVREVRYNTPEYLTEEFAEFLGIMVADGTIFRKGFRVAKRHKEFVDLFESLCLKLFNCQPKRFTALGAYQAEIRSVYLVKWLKSINGLQPNNKAIPDIVLQSNTNIQAAFLRGLFEDGSVHVNKRNGIDKLDHVELSSCFHNVIRDVKTMLLRFEIISGIVRTKDGYRIQIYGINAKKFADKIGLISECKKAKLLYEVGNECRYNVPLAKGDIDQLMKDCGGRKVLNNTEKTSIINSKMSRDVLQKLLVKYPIKNDAWNNLNDKLKFHHDKIVSITKYVGTSVCLEVPDGHQFIQDGFCGWNSQGSQFSNVLVSVEKSKYMSDSDFRRWLYTCVTRSSNKLVMAL